MVNEFLPQRLQQRLTREEILEAKGHVENAFRALTVLDAANAPNDPQFHNTLRVLSGAAQTFLAQLLQTFKTDYRHLPPDNIQRSVFRNALKKAIIIDPTS